MKMCMVQLNSRALTPHTYYIDYGNIHIICFKKLYAEPKL